MLRMRIDAGIFQDADTSMRWPKQASHEIEAVLFTLLAPARPRPSRPTLLVAMPAD